MSMLIIQPVAVTDQVLVSSSVTETAALWSATTNYTLGTRVRRPTNRVYENLQAGVNASLPESTRERWLDVGPTNTHAMFDNEVGTITRGANSIRVTVRPGQIGGIAWLELDGVTDIYVSMTTQATGALVYERVVNLEVNDILDIWDFFFMPFEAGTDAVLSDLPAFSDGVLTFTLVGGPTVGCGVCKFGTVHVMGDTELGARLGIVSYSRKKKNDFGRYTFVPSERGYGKTMDLTVVMPSAAFNRAARLLPKLLDVPCIYVLDDGPGFEAGILFGIYLDFFMLIDYQDEVSCGLQLEGLI